MVKNKQPRKPLDLSALKSLGSGLKEVAIAMATHPAITGLGVMTASALLQAAFKPMENSENERTARIGRDINYQLGGLYNGAQTIAVASAVVPLAITGIEAVSKFAASGLGGKH